MQHARLRVKQLRSIGKCVGTTFLGCLSSTRWTGVFLHLLHLANVSMRMHVSRCRPGANPWRVIEQIRTKLRIQAAAVQVPIGLEDDLRGVVDLVRWKAIYNEGQKG